MKILHHLTVKAVIAHGMLLLFAYSGLAQATSNIPIDFYGKVIDQRGQPIAGASVNLEVVADRFELNTTDEKKYALKTDQNGKFSLTGVFGSSVQVSSIEKNGYELSGKTIRTYSYTLTPANHHPDPNVPVIFRMWKSAGRESLINSAWRGKVACDGTTNSFDLLSGKLQHDGNLQIICTRTPLNYEQSYDYKIEIVIGGGGILVTDDEFTYLAPEGNYSHSIAIDHKRGNPGWAAGVRQDFYIKTAEGHYGCLHVEWDAGHRPSPTILKWNFTANPSGSRILER